MKEKVKLDVRSKLDSNMVLKRKLVLWIWVCMKKGEKEQLGEIHPIDGCQLQSTLIHVLHEDKMRSFFKNFDIVSFKSKLKYFL